MIGISFKYLCLTIGIAVAGLILVTWVLWRDSHPKCYHCGKRSPDKRWKYCGHGRDKCRVCPACGKEDFSETGLDW